MQSHEIYDEKGPERRFTIQSTYQAGDTQLRILMPDSAEPVNRMVHILPVEPSKNTQYGDGFNTFRNLNLHNHHHVAALTTSFTNYPWYANHPTNPHIQQERYYVEHIVPFVQSLYPQIEFKHLLLGFSKSGVGAMSLMLRNPDMFHAVAVWDTTFLEDTPDKWEMREIFGTNSNYNGYKIKQLLHRHTKILHQRTRIALSGYGIFRCDVEASHQLMVNLNIPHEYSCDHQYEHHWEGGWMEQSVAALDRLSKIVD